MDTLDEALTTLQCMKAMAMIRINCLMSSHSKNFHRKEKISRLF